MLAMVPFRVNSTLKRCRRFLPLDGAHLGMLGRTQEQVIRCRARCGFGVFGVWTHNFFFTILVVLLSFVE